MGSNRNEKSKICIELFSSNYNRIKSFIFSLVPNTSDADDVMQETSRIIWEKFEEFEVGTNFLAWAFASSAIYTRSGCECYSPCKATERFQTY